MFEVRGIAAIVTGGASGLGRAAALALAGQGAHVVVADRDTTRGPEVAELAGGVFAEVDVCATEDVVAATEAAAALGPLRVLVNCAGIAAAARTIGRDGMLASAHDLDLFRRVLEVNLVGTFNCVRVVATTMAGLDPDEDGARGVIVNTASLAAWEGQVGQAAYAASKGGIVGMTLPLARDLAVAGIRVCTVAPGLVDTPIYGEGERATTFKEHLARDVVFPTRFGRPDEYASLVLELVRNSYMNGTTVRMDGGARLGPR